MRTVYADNSFTETLYSYGTTPVTKDAEGDTIPTPAGYEVGQALATGGSGVVRINQRQTGDAPVVTFNLYDAPGRLTDVWQPPVVDADSSSPTYGLSQNGNPGYWNLAVRPHTHYDYDAAGNEVRQITPDEQGPLDAWLDSSTGATPHTVENFVGDTVYGYDQYGRQVRQVLPYDDANAQRPTSTSRFNAFGQKTIDVDDRAPSTENFHDPSPDRGAFPTATKLTSRPRAEPAAGRSS